ncbi:MAG: multidrug effflux MFS transporter [Bifidobacteriaceae bacterium]|jgi:DHA1 family bicyclomycin/chloramphenicol resistance-like MFS transporter|nr:multidrug effflux MFS transporter [Bifidobacteriaceae bacterium]
METDENDENLGTIAPRQEKGRFGLFVAAHAPKSNKSTAVWVILLGSLAALPAFTTDLYLSALPQVAKDFHSNDSTVQLTITLMMLGTAFGQLIIGPIADRHGRKVPVIVGLIAHIILSIAIVLSTSIGMLIGLRFAQGLANAALNNASMAILRDRFSGAQAASMMSRLMLVIGLSPLLAPSIGSFLVPVGGWKLCFIVLAVMGVALLLAVLLVLPETNGVGHRVTTSLSASFRDYGRLVKDGTFAALALVPGFSSGCIMSYVVSISFILQDHYSLSPFQFALFFAANGVGLVVFAQVNAAMVPKVGPVRMLRRALPLQLLVAFCLLIVCFFFSANMWLFMAVLLGMFCFQGFVPANATALALTRHGEIAGSASAVIGFLQTGMGSVLSTCASMLGAFFATKSFANPNADSMGTMIFLSLLTSTLVVTLFTNVIRPNGPDVSRIETVDV